MGEAKRRKAKMVAMMATSTPVDLKEFAQYILPAAPLHFVERMAEMGFGEGTHNPGKDIALNELKKREHEQREYDGAEPMDDYLEATMALKLSRKISAKDSVRWHDAKQALMFAVYDEQANFSGILMVKPSVLRQYGGPQ